MPDLPKGRVKRELDGYDPAPLDGAYARSKARAAQLVLDMVRNDGLPAVLALPSGIIGPYCGKGNHLVQLVKNYCCGKLPGIVKGGYDFVDVRDVALGVIAAAERGTIGESYLLTGNFHTLKQTVSMLHEITGKKKVPLRNGLQSAGTANRCSPPMPCASCWKTHAIRTTRPPQNSVTARGNCTRRWKTRSNGCMRRERSPKRGPPPRSAADAARIRAPSDNP